MSDVSPERQAKIEAFLRGTMPPEERRAFEEEIFRDRELANTVFEDLNVDAALEELREEAAPTTRRSWWRSPRVVVPLAAAATIAVAFLIRPVDDVGRPGSTLRSPAGEVRALSPAGEVSGRPGRLAWTGRPDAATYRVEIFDVSGAVVFQAETAETTLAWPAEADTLLLGSWRVVPESAAGAELPASRKVAFRISP